MDKKREQTFYSLRSVFDKVASIIDYLLLHRFVYPVKAVVLWIEEEWKSLKDLIYHVFDEVERTVIGLCQIHEVIAIAQTYASG